MMITQNRIKTVLILAVVAMAIGGLAATSVSATWTPADLTNGAELWLDATDADTITKDASNLVSQWNDKSGNGVIWHRLVMGNQ